MIEKFRGYTVPAAHSAVYAALERSVNKFNAEIACGACGSYNCIDLSCRQCIFNWEGEGCDDRIDAFAAYAEGRGFKITREGVTAPGSRPELVPGMVIKTIDGSFYLYIGAEKFKMLKIVKPYNGSADFSVIGPRYKDLDESWISSIFYWDDASSDYGAGLSPYNVGVVLRGGIQSTVPGFGGSSCIKEWRKPSPVKMTVAEISEKLGYEVEIVADKERR